MIQQFLIAATEEVTKPNALGTFGIDKLRFLGSLVNFGLVMFIFWKYISGPLGKLLTERQARIESGLKNAEYMDAEKKRFEEWKQSEMKKVRVEADHIMRMTNDT